MMIKLGGAVAEKLKELKKELRKRALKRRKISEELAEKLKADYIPYRTSFRELGEKYNLPITTVQYIVKKRFTV